MATTRSISGLMALAVMYTVLLVHLGSAIWVWVDARGRDWSHDGIGRTPGQWCLGVLAFWPIVFPIYLLRRNRAPVAAA